MPALLADAVIDPRAEEDLTWYYCWSEGEMGLRSSFGAMVAQLQSGAPGGGSTLDLEMDERKLEAAERARQIRRSLERLPAARQRTLYVMFGPDARALPGLGRLAAVAELTESAQRGWSTSETTHSFGEWLVRLCSRAARPAPKRKKRSLDEEKATNADVKLVADIASEADSMVRRALSSFVASRRSRVRW